MRVEPWYWLVFGIVLMIAELFLPSFAFLLFGVAAVIVALIYWLIPLSYWALVLIWLGLSLVLCVLWFRFINPKIYTKSKAGLGASVIIGDVGMLVVVPMVQQAGVVRFNVPKAGASEWACRSNSSQPLQVGDRVVVVDIIGNELLIDKK